jgi:ATP-dependent Clp protease ATP-binding subunit ClpA
MSICFPKAFSITSILTCSCLKKDPHSLKSRISDLAKKQLTHLDQVQQSTLIEGFKSPNTPKFSKDLAKILQNLDNKELNDVLKQLVQYCYETNDLQKIETLQSSITLEKLEQLVKETTVNFESTTATAEKVDRLAAKLKSFSMKKKSELNTDLKKGKPFIFRFIAGFLNALINGLKMLDMGKPPSSIWELSYTLGIYASIGAALVEIFKLMLGYLQDPLTTAAVYASIWIIGSIAAYIYFKFFHPAPRELPNCKNITTEVKQGQTLPLIGREVDINNLINVLVSNNNSRQTKQHPVLVGNSGVGKTELIYELARRISEGNVPPALKNKQVFILKASKMLPDPGMISYMSAWEELSERMGNHKKDIIIFCDEIHEIWKGKGKSAGDLQGLLDTSTDHLEFFIGATTYKDLADMGIRNLNDQIDRRYLPIEIKETTEEDNSAGIAFDPEKDHDLLKYVIKKTNKHMPKKAQPFKAMTILSRSIAKVEQSRTSEGQEKLKKLENDYTKATSQLSLVNLEGEKVNNPQIKQVLDLIENLEKQIANCKTEKAQNKQAFKTYLHLKDTSKKLAKTIHDLCPMLIKNGPKKDKKTVLLKKKFLFSKFIMEPALNKTIKKVIDESHLNIHLTKKVIKTVIKESLAKTQK